MTSSALSSALTAAYPRVRVLDLDADLADAVCADQRSAAAEAALAPLVRLERGPWDLIPTPADAVLGALMLDGIVTSRVTSGCRSHVELLSDGDLITPWSESSEFSDASDAVVEVLQPGSALLLDRVFALRAARWPEIESALIRKVIQRARRLGQQSAINAIPRTEERLEQTLWRLSDRFGRVRRDGILLRLPLTHALLAEMIGTQRPSVTLAIGQMETAGRLHRLSRTEWLLSTAESSPVERDANDDVR